MEGLVSISQLMQNMAVVRAMNSSLEPQSWGRMFVETKIPKQARHPHFSDIGAVEASRS